MDTSPLIQALRGAAAPPVPGPLRPAGSLLVLGAGGALGSALLAQALAEGRFARVMALVAAPLASALRGLQPLPLQALQGPDALGAEAAVIVFERQRHSNGRDEAFVMPEPAELLPLASALRARGVTRLVVVVPHAPALLPLALAHGLATLDEAAVAALGFEHLVFMRPSQDATAASTGGWLQRFALWWLSQLRWMVPQRQQPLRAVVLARCAVHLLRLLPAAAPGTRVLATEQLWLLAQQEDALPDLLAAWLGVAAQP